MEMIDERGYVVEDPRWVQAALGWEGSVCLPAFVSWQGEGVSHQHR